MNENHVTLPPSAAGTPTGEAHFGSHTANHDSSSRQRHSLRPGQDGYITPTWEDNVSGYSNNNSRICLPQTRPNLLARQSANASSSSITQAFRELQWRERIRHYTWNFFAMTMATGGIANVLYTGMLGV